MTPHTGLGKGTNYKLRSRDLCTSIYFSEERVFMIYFVYVHSGPLPGAGTLKVTEGARSRKQMTDEPVRSFVYLGWSVSRSLLDSPVLTDTRTKYSTKTKRRGVESGTCPSCKGRRWTQESTSP